jgi:hypothetical protein
MMFPKHCIRWSYLYCCWRSLTCKNKVLPFNLEDDIRVGQCRQLNNRKASVSESEGQCPIAGQGNKILHKNHFTSYWILNLFISAFTRRLQRICSPATGSRCDHAEVFPVVVMVLGKYFTVRIQHDKRCTVCRVSSPFQLGQSVYEAEDFSSIRNTIETKNVTALCSCTSDNS